MNDYTVLLDFMRGRIEDGDIVEIGAFKGVGTRQLAEAFPDKIIHSVDVFDIHFDKAKNMGGIPMSKFYEDELGGRDQLVVFQENTRGLENVVRHETDSTKFEPEDEVWLTIIDGGHSTAVLKKDIKNAMMSRYIAFHDYKHDLPDVTKTIDKMTEGWTRYEIGSTWLVVEPPSD